jgi:hypothetical protein
LNGAYGESLKDFTPEYDSDDQNSAMLREYCLRQAMGIKMEASKGQWQLSDDGDDGKEYNYNIRSWKKDSTTTDSTKNN